MQSSSDIRPHDGWPIPPTDRRVSEHRFTDPVVRELPRRVVIANFDPRVW
jgi:hypothetical protein